MRTVDVNLLNWADPRNKVQEVFGLTMQKVKVSLINLPCPSKNVPEVVGARMRTPKVSITNPSDLFKNVQEVVGAKGSTAKYRPTCPWGNVQDGVGVAIRKAKGNLESPTDPWNKVREVVVVRESAVKVNFTYPNDPYNEVKEVVSARMRTAKVSLTNPSDPCKNVQEVLCVKGSTARYRRTGLWGNVQHGVGVIMRKSNCNLTSHTDPWIKVREVVGMRDSAVKDNFAYPHDPYNDVSDVVGVKTRTVDGKIFVKENMCSSVSPEERIFEMASSANINRVDFLENYIRFSVISKGGFGVVFTGLRIQDRLPVVMKYIPMKRVKWEKVTCNGREFAVILEVALMLKAAGLPGSFGKSTSVSLLDWYILDQLLILIMERPLHCMDLQQYLKSRGGSLSEPEAKIILKQLVDAAIDMESKGVFHRDIKCENVLVELNSRQPRVRVIDFGCGSFSSETAYSSFSGTLKYSPPEWFSIQTYWSYSTTVWQLGALFYSLLGGNFSTKLFISNKITINSSLSTDVKSMLEMCLNIKPYERATLREIQLHPMFTQPAPRT